jgi:GNAT superfamily N-acetyltransferase
MNVPACTLRRATRADATALLQLICALAEFENLEPPDAEAQQRLLEDAFGEQPRIETWLAFVDGCTEPVGYAIVLETYSSFLARPTLYLEDVFVLPEFRNRGIGSAFLRHCVALAHERGCGRMEWTCLDWNTRAQRVYEDKLGAQRMSEWYLYRLTRPAMEKYLSGPFNL